jgi:hypothetical protein
MMTTIMIINMEGEDYLATCFTFKTPARIQFFRSSTINSNDIFI